MSRNGRFLNWLRTAVLMMVLWFLMSQKTEPKFLILGIVSSALIALVCLRPLTMKGCKTETSYYLIQVNLLKFIVYFAWLLVQIVKSAYYVSCKAVKGIADDEPSIVWFRADYDNPAARTMLANSITLTPGTITIDISEDGLYSVHALTRELADGVLDGSMQQKVAWLYGETIDFAPASSQDAVKSTIDARPRAVRGIGRTGRRRLDD